MCSARFWYMAKKALPTPNQEVSVKGDDTQGSWVIQGGVYWLPYKGQPKNKGRFVTKSKIGEPTRLPESEDVTHWSYV